MSVRSTRMSVFVSLFIVLAAFSVQAQDSGSDANLDELFGGDMVENPENVPAPTQNPVTAALATEKVRIGGSFYGSLEAAATWQDLWGGGSDLLSADTTSLDTVLKSTVFFDARPSEDFRVYGSTKVAWPFSTTKTFLTSATDTGGTLITTSDSIAVPNIKVFELFSDFSLNDQVFFRFGKSTVKWGVGYFWSPADVINLEPINVLDATAQREGPINFRVHIPVLGTQNNFYLYAILDEDNVDFSTTALAAKAEFLLGNYELGTGIYYRDDTAERAMLTLTGPVGNFDIFGEAMLSRGSAKTFVTDIATTTPYTITTSTSSDHRDSLYFSASAGFMYSSPKDNFTAIGQYYYNGEGYSEADRNSLIADANTVIAALGATPTAAQYQQALAGLIYGSGRHYAALSVTQDEFLTKDTSISLLVLANLSDGSGFVRPSISWDVVDNFKFSLSPTFVFGGANTEYSILAGGDTVSISLGAIVSGSF